MYRKILIYALSFASLIALLTLFVLHLTGKSDLLIAMMAEYMRWLKQGPFFIVLIVFVLSSFGSSYVITFGIFQHVVSESFTHKIFWFSFAFFLIIQLIANYLQRVHKLGPFQHLNRREVPFGPFGYAWNWYSKLPPYISGEIESPDICNDICKKMADFKVLIL